MNPHRPSNAVVIRLPLFPLLLLLTSHAAAPLLAQSGPAPVEVETLVRRRVASGQLFLGTVKPTRRSVIGSAVDGRVEQFFVEEGDYVSWDVKTAGPALTQLLTKTISIEVDAAKAGLQLRMKEWEELRNGSRPEEISQATARREAAKAMASYAEKKFKRIESLFQRKGASEEDFELAKSGRESAQQFLLEAQAALELVQKGPRQERVDQARARILVAEEEVRRLDDRRSKYTIRAPFAGYVAAKHVEVGNWVSQGDPVVELVELDPVEIALAVPEQHIVHMYRGMEAQIRVDSLPDEQLTGKIAKIVPDADPRSRTFPVLVRLQNPTDDHDGHKLKAGMLCRVTLAVGRVKEVLLAPKDALILERSNTRLMFVTKDPQTKRTVAAVAPVEVGIVDGRLIEVISRGPVLEAGLRVVVKGNERLRPGQEVRVLPTKAGAGARVQP